MLHIFEVEYEFVLRENMVGLEEALKTLPSGSKAIVWIPWRLAYGEEGNFLNILQIFSLTLLKVVVIWFHQRLICSSI